MEDYPENKNWKDFTHSAIKAGLSSVPAAGGAISVLFETVFSAPLDNRKNNWIKEIATVIDELQLKVDGLTPENLSKNDEFISIVQQSSNIAIRSHHSEKLKALRNAVKNTVLIENYEESKKMIFLRVIDEMTPLHFRLLDFLIYSNKYVKALEERQNPNIKQNWVSLAFVWNQTFTDISSNDPMIEMVVSDLFKFGLVSTKDFHLSSLDSNSTNTGQDFLRFIS